MIMSRKVLAGIIAAIIAGVGLVIAGVLVRPAFITLGIVVALFGVWIFLASMVRKKTTGLFDERTAPEKAERRLKMLKTLVLAAGISFVVGVVGTILHNVLYGLLDKEEPVSFFLAVVGLFGFVAAALAGLILFLTGRRKKRVHI